MGEAEVALQEAAVHGGSGAMFDRIAERYDLLNRLMSLGMDRRWRRHLVAALDCPAGRVLDVATGTADVALSIAAAWPDTSVVGLDPSVGMLEVGATKVKARGLSERVQLVAGDARELPFDDDHFAASCISFGIRNVPDRDLGLREMVRVTAPGGVVAVLELGEPDSGWLAPFARFHVHHVVPRLGAWLSGQREYRYLQSSVAAFPPSAAFAEQMCGAGVGQVTVRPYAFGAAHLYAGNVPLVG
jgi:demethylmenaquinone methyltransferase/2-methoxy-6-polyprenyl-1,4-benzoquinol methylase